MPSRSRPIMRSPLARPRNHHFERAFEAAREPRSSTRSSRCVGMFLPTKSILIGSSRWPRSTSPTTCTRARAAEVHQRVHRRADRAAGADDVVDQHDDAVVDGATASRSCAAAGARRARRGRRGRAWCRGCRPARSRPVISCSCAAICARAARRRSGSRPGRGRAASRCARRSRARCAPARGGSRRRRGRRGASSAAPARGAPRGTAVGIAAHVGCRRRSQEGSRPPCRTFVRLAGRT